MYTHVRGVFRLSSRPFLLCLLPPPGACSPVCVEVPSETEAVQGNAMKLRCISCMKREEVEATTVVEWFYRPEGGKDFLVRWLPPRPWPSPTGLCSVCLTPGGGEDDLTGPGSFSPSAAGSSPPQRPAASVYPASGQEGPWASHKPSWSQQKER